jgi:hypothetical protein
MSNALAMLVGANPVPPSRRDEIQGRALALTGAWQTVEPILSPDPRRARRRTAVAVIAGLSLLVAVGTALALRADWFDFSHAEPAPPKVMKSFAALDVGAPPGMATGVIASEARRVPVADNNGRTHAFWVAPTRHGGWCVEIPSVGDGGCERLGTLPLSTAWTSAGPDGRRPPNHATTQIDGWANARYVDSVAIRFADGKVVRPAVVWVSPPIHGGFFLYDVPPAHLKLGHEATSVEAYDAAGNLVTADEPSVERIPPPDAVMDDRTELARTLTAEGDAILWTAPTRYDSSCYWVEIGGEPRSLGPCLPAGYANEPGRPRFRLIPTAHAVVVVGRVNPRFEHVVLGWADFTETNAPLEDGILLYAIPAEHLTPETQLVEIRVTTRQGSTVINEQVLPGLPPCMTPLPTTAKCR